MTASVVALMLMPIALLAYTLRAGRGHEQRPMSNDERAHRWRQKLDKRIGLDSEEFHQLHALGSEAKQRLLLRCRKPKKRKARKATPQTVPMIAKRQGELPRLELVEIRPLKPLRKMDRSEWLRLVDERKRLAS